MLKLNNKKKKKDVGDGDCDFSIPGREYARRLSALNLVILVSVFIILIFLSVYDIWFNPTKKYIYSHYTGALIKFFHIKPNVQIFGMGAGLFFYVLSWVIAFLWFVLFPFLFHKSFVLASYSQKPFRTLQTLGRMMIWGLPIIFVACLHFRTKFGFDDDTLGIANQEEAKLIEEAQRTEKKNVKQALLEFQGEERTTLHSAHAKKAATKFPTAAHRGLIGSNKLLDGVKNNIEEDYKKNNEQEAEVSSLDPNAGEQGTNPAPHKKNAGFFHAIKQKLTINKIQPKQFDDTFMYMADGSISHSKNSSFHPNNIPVNKQAAHTKMVKTNTSTLEHELTGKDFEKNKKMTDLDLSLLQPMPKEVSFDHPYDRILKMHNDYKNGQITYEQFQQAKKDILRK